MGIRIKAGNTEAARREMWAYTNAFTAVNWGEDAEGNELWVTFDPTDAPMYQDMADNAVVGFFDPTKEED